ncbi:MAG: septum formation initiator family protein [Actinobacteria bacterium]|nr:septum formation initiator family protein [Actinomycetota bacterium]
MAEPDRPSRPPSPPSPPRPGRPPLRPTKLTGRAALLAVVMCAIALSLAYPVREYIGQRRQIDQLLATQQSLSQQVKSLQAEQSKLSDPSYIEQQARDQLHYCMPDEKCYVIVGNSPAPDSTAPQKATPTSWYAKLWGSVQKADQPAGK